MDADLLAEIIHVMVAMWSHDVGDEGASNGRRKQQDAFALDILDALSQTGRFSLILDFLDNNQLEKLQNLFALLDASSAQEASSSKQESRLSALKTKFKI